jgi:hypothetical protein
MLTFAFLVAVSVSTAAAAALVPLAVAADQLVTATITLEPSLPATLYGTTKACKTSLCADYINACGM